MSVRWGVVGCGWITSDKIAPAIRHSQEGELVAFLSREQARGEEYAARFGARRAHTEFSSFLADDEIDAVFLATPNGQHAAEAMRCARAGKHVLVEKPMATTVPDAAAMIEICREQGVRLSVGYQMRFHPAHAEAARLVHSGALGKIVSARAQLFFRYPTPPPAWRRAAESAGWWALGDVGTHALDLLQWLLGEVQEVDAFLGSFRFGYPTEDTAALMLRFQSGAVASLDCSTAAFAPESRLEVYGLDGHVIGQNTLGMAAVGSLRSGDNAGARHDFSYTPIDPYVAEIDAFNRDILEDREPTIAPEDGLHNVAIMAAAAQASATRQTVRVARA